MSKKNYFQNSTLPAKERAIDIVSRLTLEEKIGMVTSNLDAVPRLGIPKTHFGVEIARGLVQRDQQRETTILPQPWGLAATFDQLLLEQLGDIAGDEVRISNQLEEKPSSLVLFGPTVDMERDPRWGRNEEAYGEDPYLTGHLTAAYTRGLAGTDPRYLKCAPLLKHFYANNSENERQTTNANITPQLKYDYYLKAFEPAIREGGAAGLMTSYNLINGVEGINNPDVTEICKKEWGMLFSVSDGGDFGQNVAAHRSYENHAKSIGAILGQGADMMLDSRDMVDPAVREALERGYLTEARLDKVLIDLFQLRFLLGEFDPDENPYAHMDPTKLASSEHKKLAVQAAEESVILLENKGLLPLQDDGHCTVAVVGPLSNENYICWYCGYAAKQTSVVQGLRERLGENRVLFDEGLDHIAIKSRKSGKYVRLQENGTLVADTPNLELAEVFERNDWDYGSWTLRSLKNRLYVREGTTQKEEGKVSVNPEICCVSSQTFGWFVMELIKVTEVNGISYLSSWQSREILTEESGRLVSSTLPGNDNAKEFEIVLVSSGKQRCEALAKKADYAIVCGGNHPLINAREEYDRPDINLPHAQSALLNAVCDANENTVLYLVTSYPFAIVEERKKVKAVICSTHLGPSLGHVAARTIFGENNPAGRTPTTWYQSLRDLPDLEDYDIAKNKTTYLYFEGEPLYPFGYGLSYTSFAYSDMVTEKDAYGHGEIVQTTVTVTNTGSYDGDEVLQLYVVPPKSVYRRPKKLLKAFCRVHVKAGEAVQATLCFPVSALAFWSTDEEKYIVEQGDYQLELGASSLDIRCVKTLHVDGILITGKDAKKNAIDADDYHKVQFCTDKRDGITYLEAENFRSFALYQGLNLQGCNAIEMLISSPAGNMELILADNQTGKIIGTCSCEGTGSLTRFCTVSCAIIPQNGLVDLRICFTKQSSLKSFRFYFEK